MSKINRSSYPKSTRTFKNDALFYEELTILRAQETIAELMENRNTSKAELAQFLNQSKSHVTELLSDGRNLTLRTFARVCFHLKAEIDFKTYVIGASKKKLTKFVSYQFKNDKDFFSSTSHHPINSTHLSKWIQSVPSTYKQKNMNQYNFFQKSENKIA